MADYSNIKRRVQEVIRPNGVGAITAADHQELLLDIVEQVEQNENELKEQYDHKAEPDGKYPQMTAGFANNLVGRGEAVDATINFRPSGGTSIEDGAARVKELNGNSVVWNQKADARNVTGSNTTITNISEHGFDMSAPQQSANMYALLGPLFSNRVYYVGFSYSSTLAYTLQYMGGQREMEASSSLRHIGIVAKQLSEPYTSIYWYIFGGTNAEWKLQVRDLVVYDLTQMFGAGNEPTSVEEFYNRFPQNVDLYAYNEGEIVSTNAEGIKSVGFNAWDEEWELGGYNYLTGVKESSVDGIRCKNFISVVGNTSYYCHNGSYAGQNETIVICYNRHQEYIKYIASGNTFFTTPEDARYITFYTLGTTYNHDICINLAHSGYRNGEYQPYMQFIRDIDPRIREAFPNGMRSAGTASDKVYNKNGKGVIEKRIGVVDMGTLDWRSAGNGEFLAEVQDYGLAYTATNLLCKFYQPTALLGVDKTIRYYDSYFGNYVLGVYDSAYTDAATFKAAMSGVMLYYELAEPIITEYDEPFNLDYEVWDFGTEQMLSSEPSAPIKASIVYGFNAVDSIRTAQLEIEALKTQLAQMQTLMASMTAQSAALTE